MKLIILISLFLSTSVFATPTPQGSSAHKRLSKWKVKYCDNTSKRKIASDCKMKYPKK